MFYTSHVFRIVFHYISKFQQVIYILAVIPVKTDNSTGASKEKLNPVVKIQCGGTLEDILKNVTIYHKF